MKKSYLIMAAIASLALVSCSDEEFTGNPELGPGQGTGEINFGLIGKGMTRADLYGADAADKLGGKFYVGGYKNVGTGDGTTSTVFDNYSIEWGANTAGTTTDNSSDWKYVGLTNPTFTGHVQGTQTIKYWDFAANYYDFVAFSPGKGNTIITTSSEGHPAANEILATAIEYSTIGTQAYTLTGQQTYRPCL